MKESRLITSIHPFPAGLADIITPVTIYLKIRDKFPNAILLESSDYHGNSNSMSYICFDVMGEFKVEDYKINISFPDGSKEQILIKDKHTLPEVFNTFLKSFKIESNSDSNGISTNGLFGYTSYDAVKYFENIHFSKTVTEQYQIPDICYSLYRYIIAINHFNNRIYLTENLQEGDNSRLEEVKSLLRNRSLGAFQFMSLDNEKSNITDKEYIEMVKLGKSIVFLVMCFRLFCRGNSVSSFTVMNSMFTDHCVI